MSMCVRQVTFVDRTERQLGTRVPEYISACVEKQLNVILEIMGHKETQISSHIQWPFDDGRYRGRQQQT